jgi:hypothetical protein
MAASLRLYLCGPITKFPGHREAFAAAAVAVRALGHEVICPLDTASLGGVEGDWDLAMRADITVLLHADGIVLLPGWPQSRGAKIELQLAVALEKRILTYLNGEIFDVTEPAHANPSFRLGRAL